MMNPLITHDSRLDDVEAWLEAERQRLLARALPALMICAPVAAAIPLIVRLRATGSDGVFAALALVLGAEAAWGLAWLWNRRGKTRGATHVLLASLMTIAVAMAVVYTDLIVIYAILALLTTILACLLFSPRAGYMYATVVTVVGLTLAVLIEVDVIVPPLNLYGPALVWADVTAYVFSMLLGVYFVAFNRQATLRLLKGLQDHGDGLGAVNAQLAQEVAERRQAEAQARAAERHYQSLLQNAPVAITVHGADTSIIDSNALASQLLGLDQETMPGRDTENTAWRFVEEDGGMMTPDMLPVNRVLASREPLRDFVFGIIRPGDTEPVWVLTNHVPELDEQGQVARILVTAMDITERRRLLARLQQASKMEAVGRLAGGVAHRYNNLMTSVIGYAELLLDSLGSNDMRRADVLAIRQAAREAGGLTRQLLSFSRRQMLRPQAVAINEVVTAMVAQFQENLAQISPADRLHCTQPIEIVTELDAAAGLARVDQRQLAEVLRELLENGCDAMPDGGTLTVSTEAVSLPPHVSETLALKAGEYVRITVRDTGIGMSDETRSHLFEPFFTTKPTGQGSGLGLASAYGVIRQSDGAIEVESERGHGSAFHVYLPQAVAQPAHDAGVETPISAVVLVVDDEATVRRTVVRALQLKGYTVLEAEHPAQAIDICQEHKGHVDLLVTDVAMPRMSGRELAANLRQSWPGLRVLFISGYPGDAVVQQGWMPEDGMFLQKPFSPAMLYAQVQTLLKETSH